MPGGVNSSSEAMETGRREIGVRDAASCPHTAPPGTWHHWLYGLKVQLSIFASPGASETHPSKQEVTRMFSTKRLKKKSQSVDVTTHGYSGTLIKDGQASPVNSRASPVTRATVLGEEEKKAFDSQRSHSPRHSELKRFYTVDASQRKDVRRISSQKPRGTMEYCVESQDTLNSIALKFDTTPNELVQLNKLFSRAVLPGQVLFVPDPEYISSAESSPSFSPISPLSPTASEADVEKVTTDSDGAPRKKVLPRSAHIFTRSTRVVSSTSEEEEALTEKFLKIDCKYITDSKGTVGGVLLITPNNIMFDPLRTDPLVQEHGCEEYGIMCPLEEVMSIAVCREITEKKVRESIPVELEQLWSGHDPRGMSHSEVETTDEATLRPRDLGNDSGSTAPRSTEGSFSEDVFTESELSPIREEPLSSDELRGGRSSGASSESVRTVGQVKAKGAGPPLMESRTAQRQESSRTKLPISGGDEAVSPAVCKMQASSEISVDPPIGGSPEKPKLDHQDPGKDGQLLASMQEKTAEDEETVPPAETQQAKEGGEPAEASRVRRRHQSHKFLCLRVGKPMRKTFVSHASASMQQYAQRDRKHEYWFAIPQERTDHLYLFFIQWSPDVHTEGAGGLSWGPGFTAVKRNEHLGAKEQQSKADISAKEWEITTKEENRIKPGFSKGDLELDAVKPNLSEPSELLKADQIEKIARNLPPRTIGYPWSLAYSTSKHGMSIKTLYRAMQAQDSPVLLVIKDSDGQLFGALASEPFKISDGFYGTGETFLFTFYPAFEVFRWTGDNMFFMKGDMDSLAFGGGGGEFGLWLDGDLYHGRSHSCKTFANRMLSKKEDFYIQDIEIWSFE
ncbi:oxidation resistance protein 1-like isoform X3 [Arapaima gigas]